MQYGIWIYLHEIKERIIYTFMFNLKNVINKGNRYCFVYFLKLNGNTGYFTVDHAAGAQVISKLSDVRVILKPVIGSLFR